MQGWKQSSKANPCPICGRTKDGDCRVRKDGQMVFCHRGSSSCPPDDLSVGEILTDGAGREWAYTGESGSGSRDGAVFVIHEERAPQGLATCPPPPPVSRVQAHRKEEDCLQTTYVYRQDLRVQRYDYEHKKKEFIPQFFLNDAWHSASGPEIWPFYGTIGVNGESFIIEVEGEKCVDVLRAQGIAAITHPGHQRDEISCGARYGSLKTAGVTRVCFISDNDKAGRDKAKAFEKYADKAGIDFSVIAAEAIWPEIPQGGSVDDMPPEQLTTLIPAALATVKGTKPSAIDKVSYAKLKKALEEFYEQHPETYAEVAAGIADIATSHDASVYDAKRIWDSLEEDRDVAAEALSATSAIAARQDLKVRRDKLSIFDYVPQAAAEASKTLTGNLSCDDLTAVSIILTTVSGVVKAGHRLDAGDGLFVKGPVMWTLLCGGSGTGKSPNMTILSRDRLRLVLQHYNKRTEEIQDAFYKRCGEVPKKQWPQEPEPLRTCITDFTTESLSGIIADNHHEGLGTYIYSEEVREILGNFDEYKGKGKGRGKETFLCLFDGNVNTQHRVGRRSKMVVGKAQNALLGATQPGVFRGMLENGDDAGLIARCLVCPLPNEFTEPNFFRTPAEITAVHLAEQALENFYLRCLSVDPLMLRLEREAVEMFALLSRDTYNKAQLVSLESQRAVFGKRLGYVLQVAITMHIARVAAGEEDPANLYVSKQTLAKAVIFVDLLQAYAIVEQQESQMQQHGSFDMPRRIHSYAKARGALTAAQFGTACIPSRLRKSIKSYHIRSAMEQLVEMGLGEWRGKKSSSAQSGELFVAIGTFPD